MATKRLASDEYFAAQALLIANRLTCKRASVGAVIVKDNKVISTGYNGSVSGTEHCIDHECLIVDGHSEDFICRSKCDYKVQSAWNPKRIYCLCHTFPCLNCTKQLLQVGCKEWFISIDTVWMIMRRYLYSEKES